MMNALFLVPCFSHQRYNCCILSIFVTLKASFIKIFLCHCIVKLITLRYSDIKILSYTILSI